MSDAGVNTNSGKSAAILWRRLDTAGHDAARVHPFGNGWQVEGVAVFVEEGMPCCLRYTVNADGRWHTVSSRVSGWTGDRRIELDIAADTECRWSVNGTPFPDVTGCVDIDLAFTPATNLLPIRRLALPVGSTQAVPAAWLTFPAFSLERLDQRYSRRSELEYDYESLGGAFRTTLKLSPSDFVSSYPGLWCVEDDPLHT